MHHVEAAKPHLASLLTDRQPPIVAQGLAVFKRLFDGFEHVAAARSGVYMDDSGNLNVCSAAALMEKFSDDVRLATPRHSHSCLPHPLLFHLRLRLLAASVHPEWPAAHCGCCPRFAAWHVVKDQLL